MSDGDEPLIGSFSTLATMAIDASKAIDISSVENAQVAPGTIFPTAPSKATKKRARSPETEESDSESDYEPSESEYEARPSKRRCRGNMKKRKEAAAARIRKGKLAKYLGRMPVEIMAEVSSYLAPRDLLSLVRSSKVFARYLLNPSGTWVWKAAREAVLGVPPLPHDLTEQKYAVLAFGVYCQKCGATSMAPSNWELRRRWCLRCRSTIYQDPEYCDIHSSEWPLSIDTSHIVYRSWILCEGGKRCRLICRRSELNDLKRQIEELKESNDDERLEAFFKKIQWERQAVDAHATQCQKWTELRSDSRKDELRCIQDVRMAHVRKKLKEEGFLPQLVDEANLNHVRAMRVSKPLNNQAWSRMRDHAIETMKDFIREKQYALTESLKKVVQRKYSIWYGSRDPMGETWPSPSHIDRNKGLETTIRKFIEDHFTEIIESREPFADIPLDAITDTFEDLAHNYSNDTQEILFEMIPEELRLATPKETFALARTVFKSFHGHASKRLPYLVYILGAQMDHMPVPFDVASSKIISDIILSGGWNPTTMTFSQLEAADIRVECMTCAGSSEKRHGPKYHWQGAYQHATAHSGETEETRSIGWRILREHEKQRYIREAEETAITQLKIKLNGPKWRCCLCPVGRQWGEIYTEFSTETKVQDHISKEHPTALPDVQLCYLEDVNAAPHLRVSANWNSHGGA